MIRRAMDGVVVAALCVLAGQAATVYVNGTTGDDGWSGLCETWDGGTGGPKKTIQAGIGTAQPGDTVIVADSIYTGPGNRNLDYSGKAITVCSANGPAACCIDCEHKDRAARFHSGETEASVLAGFTIVCGFAVYEADGAGIACVGSSPVIRNCVIQDCHAGHNGGAVGANYSTVRIERCTFIGNSAAFAGGAVVLNYSDAYVVDCTFIGNDAACTSY